MALERIVIEVSGDPKKLKSTISELQRIGVVDDKNSKQFKKNNEKFNKGVDKSKQGLTSLQSTLAGVGLALTGAFAVQKVTQGLRAILNTTMAFEAQMSRVKAITGATNTEFQKLTQSANELGASTRFTAAEVGQLQEAYGKLGFSTTEILAASEATLNLATATGGSLAEAAEVAGSTLRAFDLQASETTRIVDVMAASFVSTPLDLETFKESMKLVAPIAKAANIPLETTTALLGTLAKAGLKGSIAGTSLKNLLANLSDENSDLSKQLGFSVKNTDDLSRAFKQLEEGNVDLTEALGLTDKRSVAAFLTLIQGTDTIDELTEAYNNASGAVKKMADTVEDNLQGDITKLNSAIDAVARSIGDGFSPSLRELTQWFIKAIGAARENADAIKNFGRVVGVAASFLVGYKGALVASSVATKGYEIATKIATFVTKGFNAALKANPIGLVIGLLTAAASALFLFKSETEDAKDAEIDLNTELDTANKALHERTRLLGLLNTENGAQKVSLNELKGSLSAAQKELDDLSETGLTTAQKMKVLTERFSEVENGVSKIPEEKVEEFFERLHDSTTDWSEDLSVLKQNILDEIDAIEAAIKAKKAYLEGTDDQTLSLAALKKALAKVKKELMEQALSGDISSASLLRFKKITNQLTAAQKRLKAALEGIDISAELIPDKEIAENLATLGDKTDQIFRDMESSSKDIGDSITDESGASAEEQTRKNEEQRQIDLANLESYAEQVRAIKQGAADFALELGNMLFESSQANIARELEELQTQKEFELELAGGNAQARADIEEKFAKKERALKRKQAQSDKDQAIFNTIVSTFTAATRALEAGPIAGPVLAAFITALGLVNLNSIIGTPLPKFEKGGWIDGNRHAHGGTMIEAEKDEFIVNRMASRKNKALLEDLNNGKLISYNRQRNIAGTFADNVAASLDFNDQNLLRAIRKASKSEQEGFYLVADALKETHNARTI